jgi:hypothetical protein
MNLPPIDREEVRRMYAARMGVDAMARELGRGIGHKRIIETLEELGLPKPSLGWNSGNVENFKGHRAPSPYDGMTIGDSYGNWTIIGERFLKTVDHPSGKSKVSMFPCRCDCGKIADINAWKLLKRLSKGCATCRSYGYATGRSYPSGSEHPAYMGDNSKKARGKAWVEREKSHPCVDCGRSFPTYCMEFDHVPERGKKLFAVNKETAAKKTIEELEAERVKCDLVCAVCHNHRTWERQMKLKHSPLPVKFFREHCDDRVPQLSPSD